MTKVLGWSYAKDGSIDPGWSIDRRLRYAIFGCCERRIAQPPKHEGRDQTPTMAPAVSRARCNPKARPRWSGETASAISASRGAPRRPLPKSSRRRPLMAIGHCVAKRDDGLTEHGQPIAPSNQTDSTTSQSLTVAPHASHGRHQGNQQDRRPSWHNSIFVACRTSSRRAARAGRTSRSRHRQRGYETQYPYRTREWSSRRNFLRDDVSWHADQRPSRSRWLETQHKRPLCRRPDSQRRSRVGRRPPSVPSRRVTMAAMIGL